MSILSCPFCGTPLSRENSSLYCSGERRHCFDIAKSGYVTLTRASGTSGDDRDMVRARTAFLDKGYYAPFAEAVAAATERFGTVIDAGRGEVTDGMVVYKISAERLLPGEYVVEVKSRVPNVWAFVVSALAAVTPFLLRLRKRK